MADSKLTKMARLAAGAPIPPTPKVPKVPESIKARHPENRAGWIEYDQMWEEYEKQKSQISS